MTHWFAFERRWRDAVLVAMLPEFEAPPDFWPRFGAVAPPILRLGFRVAIWRFAAGFGAPAARLQRAAQRRGYLTRQLVLTVKLVACFGGLGPGALRARLS